MLTFRPILVFQLALTCLTSPIDAADEAGRGVPYYNELFDADGQLRPHYVEAYARYKKMNQTQKRAFAKQAFQRRSEDSHTAPLPRLILDTEFEVLRQGANLKATAIRMFLQDHYSGQRTYLNAGIIPKDVMQRVLERNGELGFDERIPPEQISVPLGFDIIRGADGKFYELEANTGDLGGLGDLVLSRQLLLEAYPQIKEQLVPADDPEEFFRHQVERYQQRANGKRIIFLTHTDKERDDHEHLRLSAIFKQYGIERVSKYSRFKIEYTPEGLFLVDRQSSQKREPIGFVIMGGEFDLDLSDRTTYANAVVAEANESLRIYELMKRPNANGLDEHDTVMWKYGQRIPLSARNEAATKIETELRKYDPKTSDVVFLRSVLRQHAPYKYDLDALVPKLHKGLVRAILEGKVASNYVPGCDFINDKEFGLYLDRLVQFYLKTESLLKGVPGFSFASKENGESVESHLNKIRNNLPKYVIKPVVGRGGGGIMIGPTTTLQQFDEIYAPLIRNHPEDYVAFDFKHLSVLDGDIVDTRIFAFIDPQKTLISNTLWGRGVSMNGNGKVNLSDKGREYPIGIVKSAQGPCRELDVKHVTHEALKK